MNANKLNSDISFEQHKYTEVERKFTAPINASFDRCRPFADKITQLYLSHPEDDYSLRLRRIDTPDGSISYSATLKDRGSLTGDGLARLEVETVISEDAFRFYADQDRYPLLHKERVTLQDNTTVDWIAGLPYAVVEVETTKADDATTRFLAAFSSELTERTGNSDVDNECIAHALFGRDSERPAPVSAQVILHDAVRYRTRNAGPLIIGISGRSGSGKSTLARQLQEALATHPELDERAILVSTDDYHRGRRHLETTYEAPWTNWEDPRVYDTQALAQDIAAWKSGEPIRRRYFDFTTEEPVLAEALPPSTILIVEGIHANSTDLADQRHMHYEITTPLSVSLGRDLMRLMNTDRLEAAMRTPEDRLRYVLETGEPTYQATR